MNYLFHVLIFIWIFLRVNGAGFDRYSGKEIQEALKTELRHKNASEVCTIEIKACTPHEGSRIDGTCNNFKQPTKGSAKGPYLRLLPADYGNDKKDLRRSKKGFPLPPARKVRTELQTTGRVVDKLTFNIAVPHFLEFIGRDVSALNGPRDYLRKRQNCCLSAGEKDARCRPIRVPEDDPYLKVTDIRCLNFSRAETFQDAGCTPETIPPEQINFQTPLIDLSTIYGVDEKALDSVRVYEHGLLKLERKGERYLPLDISAPIINSTLSNNATLNGTKAKKTPDEASMLTMEIQTLKSNDICFQNKGNNTTCYKFGFPEVGNYDLRTTTLGIFFMREHNRLAKELHRLNPCWKDDRLFKVARQINIATATNIFMYELLPLLLGYDNMVRYGLISDRIEQLTSYTEDEVPLVYAEYEIATRYFHTFLDGRIKRYDEHYNLVGEIPISENIYQQSVLEQNKNFEEINRGTFYQQAAKVDDIQDPEISEKFYGELQKAHDLAAADIQRGRDLGVRGYNEYRHLCGMKTAKKFEDFADVMDMEKILALKKLYEEVDDVELLAGIMSENLIKGTAVGPTLFCIMAKQLQLWRFSDRFWFERGDQMHSLNLVQLNEIRRTNMARLACDNAEGIKHIQPRAFLNVDHKNAAVPCTHIYGPDLTRWQDSTCYHQQLREYQLKNELRRKEKEELLKEKMKNNAKDDQTKKDQQTDKGENKDKDTKTEDEKRKSINDPNNMIIDYSRFFDSFLSYKPEDHSRTFFG
ncbi:peroxidase domain-containing protein [Phthorimaea operculella]|nr:peroxidase domain-containing protein [Phthorimaea operculella]